MHVRETELSGAFVVEPRRSGDEARLVEGDVSCDPRPGTLRSRTAT